MKGFDILVGLVGLFGLAGLAGLAGVVGLVGFVGWRFLKEASVSHEDLESLFVVDKNGGRNIFCDLGGDAMILVM